jgi:hypothetical protein
LPVSVEQVATEGQLREFIDFPLRRFSVGMHGPARYVPLLEPTIRSWYRGTHAQAGYGPVRLYLARSAAGEVVGRTCLHHNPHFDDKLGADVALFGLTEFTNAAALGRLMEVAQAQARAAGRTAMLGPVALLPNQTGGVITSGFEQRGFVDSPWNPASYPAAYESLGFARTFEGQTWICDALGDLDPDATFPFDAGRCGDERLELHRGSRRRLAQQLPILREMLNAAFAQLPYYTRIEAAELAEQTDGLAYLLDESLLLWLTRDRTPVAFVLVVPDISEFVMTHSGRLGWREQLLLLATRQRYRRDAVLIIKGTVPQAQGRGYLTALSRELLRNLQAGGYRSLRSTFVGLDNPASAAQYVRMGGRPLHATTFYRREVG